MVRLTSAVVKATKLPVTVKTRLGWDEDSKNIEEVAERLQDVGIKALSIHGRTRAQMYKGEADWTLIAKVKNNPRIHIPIFGNGDIDSPQKAVAYKNKYGVDGVMIGRAAIGYPWIFREIKHYIKTGEIMAAPTVAERVAVCKQHLIQSVAWKGPVVGINEMRRHYANYLKGLPGIKDYRNRLVTIKESEGVQEVLEEIGQVYKDFIVERSFIVPAKQLLHQVVKRFAENKPVAHLLHSLHIYKNSKRAPDYTNHSHLHLLATGIRFAARNPLPQSLCA
jgi:nifR3 family TIM-barrel protein